jgi:hypothetical protein
MSKANTFNRQILAGFLFLLTTLTTEANVVLNWNERLIHEMRVDTLAPGIIARNLAILHSAIETAFQSAPDCPDQRIALISYKVCASLLPSHSAAFDSAIARHYPNPVPSQDRTFADDVAGKTLESFANDGASTHVTYIARLMPGIWRRTPPFFRTPELPHWKNVRPVHLKSADQFRPSGPPAMSSDRYRSALEEVRRLGANSSDARTADQTEIARFWSDFSYTETPVGHWNAIARQIALAQKPTTRATSHLFYLLNSGMADAAIACWETKYFYDSWRPITALQEGVAPLNIPAQPDWSPLLTTPSHPEYVSGHSTFSGVAAGILRRFFQTDQIDFDVASDTLKSAKRHFSSLSSCAEECSDSRVYGGIHFRFSCQDGLELGEKIADWTWAQSKRSAQNKEIR